MICLKHKRWIGHRASEQKQITDYELRTVERRYRRIASSGLITIPVHDDTAAALDRNADSLRDGLWLGYRAHAYPEIDRYPALVRVLATINDYLAEHWPFGHEIRSVHHRPEQARLYATLRSSLAWLGPPARTWKLVDELVPVVLDAIHARTDTFAADDDEFDVSA
jgi:hypothetical protein